MEGSAMTAVRRDPATVRITRIGILIAALGALLVIFNPFGGAVVGLVLALVGAVIAARGGLGKRWYVVLAGGAVLILVSRLIAEGSQVAGGWLAVVGVIAILVAASLGYPLAGDEEE